MDSYRRGEDRASNGHGHGHGYGHDDGGAYSSDRRHGRSPSPQEFRIRGAATESWRRDSTSYLDYDDPDQPRRGNSTMHRRRRRRRRDDDDDDDDDRDDYYYGYSFDRRNGVAPQERGSRSAAPRNLARHVAQDEREYRDYDSPELDTTELDYHGEGDVGDAPMTFLLVLGLDERTNERSLADAFETLVSTEAGPRAGSLRRVMLVRDRAPPEKSLGFAYAEYHSVKDSKAAMAEARKRGAEFKIDSILPRVHFPHAGVFPHAEIGKTEYKPKYLIDMPQSAGHKHKYHDTRCFVSELMVNAKSAHLSDPSKAAAAKKQKPATVNQEGFVATPEASGTKSLKRGFHIPRWESASAELRGEDKGQSQERSAKRQATGVNAIRTEPEEPEPDPSSNDQQTFVHDGDKLKACYLCNSQFQERAGLIKHCLRSEVHAKNLKDESMVDKAYRRLQMKKIDPSSTLRVPAPTSTLPPAENPPSADQRSQPLYRDRAAERRHEAAQTGTAQNIKIALKSTHGASKGTNKSAAEEKSQKTSTYGVGKNLLEKSGWTEGQGLGNSGGGIAAPIEQSMYAAGVGLGHEGSKQGDAVEEALRKTKGNDFLEATKETARRRLREMQ